MRFWFFLIFLTAFGGSIKSFVCSFSCLLQNPGNEVNKYYWNFQCFMNTKNIKAVQVWLLWCLFFHYNLHVFKTKTALTIDIVGGEGFGTETRKKHNYLLVNYTRRQDEGIKIQKFHIKFYLLYNFFTLFDSTPSSGEIQCSLTSFQVSS